jgi:hypothetical protein
MTAQTIAAVDRRRLIAFSPSPAYISFIPAWMMI